MKTLSISKLAAQLGCSRPAITKAFHEGRLTAGLRVVAGSLVVTDARACEAQWRAIRQPRPRTTETAPTASGSAVPPYEVSRARREAALADIATAEARSTTGGEWIPRAQVDALVARFAEAQRKAVWLLRERLPLAVNRRINLQELGRVLAELGARTKHTCGEPMPPISDSQVCFRIAMHEVSLAVDEVCNEVADMFEHGGSPAVADVDEEQAP
jgi:hypothetical protein